MCGCVCCLFGLVDYCDLLYLLCLCCRFDVVFAFRILFGWCLFGFALRGFVLRVGCLFGSLAGFDGLCVYVIVAELLLEVALGLVGVCGC